MQIAIFGAGSQGDIQPCIRLGKGLHQAGIHVSLATPQNYAGLIEGEGLSFYALRGDVQQVMSSETGQRFIESGGANPLNSILAMRKMLGPIAVQMAEDLLSATRNADALITLAVFAPFGKTVAEILGIPLFLLEPTPVLPSGEFPAPGWPIQKNMGRLLNRLSGFAMLEVIWQWYRPFVNQFRQRFALPRLSGTGFRQILVSTPLLGAYSPTVIPRPRDWPSNVHITGYWFQNQENDWHLPDKLETFLGKGAAPVYVGFGSMAGRNPERIARIVIEALQKSGKRGVLATGWGGMNLVKVPESVFVLDAAPHNWLFPHMAVVVHHGGAGTTAEGLRAGKPTLIVPFIVDQLFWGKRVQAMGAGVEPIAAKRLTADRLAAAIQQASSDPQLNRQANKIGVAIRSEDGVGNAVGIIRQYLGV